MKDNNQVKILFLINSLSVGGAEGVFMREKEELSLLRYQTEVYTLYPDNFKNLYDLKGYFELIQKIKKEKITHIYATLDDANFVAKIVRIFVKFKLFCREANETHDKTLKFKIADILLNFLVLKLVMVAEAVKQSYLSYDSYHKNKMTVLYNGVEIPEITREKKIQDPIKILAVGSLTPKKGFLDLIAIIRDYVGKNHSNFILEIVGDGPLLSEINLEIKRFNLEDKIKCLEGMDKASLVQKYLDSDIFVLTSKKEGCPNVLLEAASYGLAPVCFGVGAVPEIIENNISGFVVPKGDKEAFGLALSNLLCDPKRVVEMGSRARKRMIDRFSFDGHIKKLLTVLELDSN